MFVTKVELRSALATITTDISNLKSTVGSLDSTVTQLATAIERQQRTLDTISAAIKDLQDRVSALELRGPCTGC